jgi:hypothetical protein
MWEIIWKGNRKKKEKKGSVKKRCERKLKKEIVQLINWNLDLFRNQIKY